MMRWSYGLDVAMEHDTFVNLPECSDVKVHVEKVGHATCVYVDPITRAEISAKEIRSRIKGTTSTASTKVKVISVQVRIIHLKEAQYGIEPSTQKFGRPARRQHRQYLKISC